MKDARPEMLSVFCGALERLSPEDRAAYLENACGQDPELRARIEALLKAHDQAGGFLARPVLGSAATIDQPLAEKPGTVIGPYKLLQQLGEGGMGTVWMAQQTEPVRRLVAVKLIKAGMDSRQQDVRRYLGAPRQARSKRAGPSRSLGLRD